MVFLSCLDTVEWRQPQVQVLAATTKPGATSSGTNSKVRPADVGGGAGGDTGLPFLFVRAGNRGAFWACFQPVKMHLCRLVVSCMLDLVGDVRELALNTVGTSPGSKELPGLPLARSWIEQPNKVSNREGAAMNLPVIQLLLVT